MIPAAAKHHLAKFCDAFCEQGAFSVDQCGECWRRRRARTSAQAARRPTYLHGAESEMAAQLGAVSVDHLDHISEAGIEALSAPEGRRRVPIAVLLPGATFFLG